MHCNIDLLLYVTEYTEYKNANYSECTCTSIALLTVHWENIIITLLDRKFVMILSIYKY